MEDTIAIELLIDLIDKADVPDNDRMLATEYGIYTIDGFKAWEDINGSKRYSKRTMG
jgi:hypothetical protein